MLDSKFSSGIVANSPGTMTPAELTRMSGPKPGLDERVDRRARLLEDRQVGAARLDALAGGGRDRAQLRLGGGELVGAAADDRDVVAARREQLRGREPDAAASAGDDDGGSLAHADSSAGFGGPAWSARLTVESSGCPATVTRQRSARGLGGDGSGGLAALEAGGERRARRGRRARTRATSSAMRPDAASACSGSDAATGDDGDRGAVREQSADASAAASVSPADDDGAPPRELEENRHAWRLGVPHRRPQP